ncbi:hypothetical protein [Mangrovibacterium lignilyticum]|uniref:hypothetical protein n=1 Tax=Mangrovibacterium lignilyticum TaxID=2668052 RepID=UPI0013D8651E|nr:hypothetical protein [Mangrovibacterium lignilyticum]
MRQLFLYTILMGLLATACQEDELTPSLADVNRVDVLMEQQGEYGAQPLIEEWYSTYNTAVLFEYQDTLDFIYQAGSQSANDAWNDLDFPQIRSLFETEDGALPADSIAQYMAYVEQGLAFLDTTLFAYIQPGSQIASMMPPTILISASLGGASTGGFVSEGDYGVSSNDEYNYHALFNSHAMIFNVNKENLELGTESYMMDNFYLFICKLYEQNDLYELFDDEIYKYSEPYFNMVIEDAYIEDYGDDETQWTELTPNGEIPLAWFLSKGFVDAAGFYGFGFKTYKETTYPTDEDGNYIAAGTGDAYGYVKDADGNYIRDENGKLFKALKVYVYHDYIDISTSSTFLEDKDEFIRSYTNQLLYRTYDELNAYPETIQTGLKLVANTLIDWGIDLVAFNPELEQFLN